MTHSIDIKGLCTLLEKRDPVTLLDVRRKADRQASPATIEGSVWRDPEKIDDWARQLEGGKPTVVFCVKGGSVSQSVTDRLRREGLDAVFLDGGLKSWIEGGKAVKADPASIQG
jgi:rhodanese-related sulfurtransferase